MYNRNIFIAFTLVLIGMTSCKMQKQIPYFKDLEDTGLIESSSVTESKIKSNDLLNINISSLDPAAAAPFNLPLVTYADPNSDRINATPQQQSYLVDVEGYITMPITGRIKVAGLYKSEAVALIKRHLAPYLKDPVVTLSFRDQYVTVLGEVRSPGRIRISNERISLVDALGAVGDLTLYGRRNNILLIREKDGGGNEYVRININSSDFINSPYFFLQNHDVVYVEPNATRAMNAANANASIIISSISSIATVATVVLTTVSLLNK